MRTFLVALLLLSPVAVHAQHAPQAWSPVLLPAPITHTQQEPERHTMTGLLVGTVAGTAVGFGIGTFIKWFCEAEAGDCDAAVPVITVIGAVSGAVAGAIIGAAIPKGRDPAATPTVVPARSRVGSASIALGAGAFRLEDWSGAETRGNGIAARANVYAELKSWLALGPEIGIVRGGDAGDVRHGALAVRATLAGSNISPYIGANLGAYQSTGPSLEYLGGALTLGSRFSPNPDGRFFLDVEGRFARNAQNIEPMRAGVIAVGAGTYW